MAESLDGMLLSCNLELLNERMLNLDAGLLGMGEKETMQVNKAFLTAVSNYMGELFAIRHKIDAGELVPAPVKCGECRFRCCNNKCILDDPPRRDFDDDDFCSQGEREESEIK
jgi:hypothetical protein